jgi:uncharacterized protein with HEPN domain
MQPDDEALLVDMLLAAREARDLAGGYSLEEFLDDRLLQLGLEKLIENIGEAASRLSPRGRSMLPELPWQDIVGMRHRLVHGYMRVDLEKVWQVIVTDLEPLIAAIEPLAPSSTPEESP